MIGNKLNIGELKNLLSYTKKNKFLFIITCFLNIAINFITLTWCYILKKLLDSAEEYNYKKLIYFIVLSGLIFLIEAITEMTLKYTSVKFQETTFFNIRKKFVEHILSLPIKYIETKNIGNLQSIYINDLNNLKSFFTSTIFDIIKQPLMFIIALSYMLYLNWEVTIFCLLLSPLFIYFSTKITKPIYKYTKEQNEALASENSIIMNNLHGIISIKSFLLEKIMNDKYIEATKYTLSKELELTKVNSIIQPLSFGMRVIPALLSLGFGNYLLLNNKITIGSLLAIVQLQNYVLGPIMMIPGILSNVNSSTAALNRINTILSISSEKAKGQSCVKEQNSPAISINNISFIYDDNKKIINNLSLQINTNDLVAIVGKSGCGKSTLLKLILGIYTPQKGNINILGCNLKSWNTKTIRNLISIVSQDTYIYPDSIYKNILYGNLNASKEEVISAAKAANIHEFIISLPYGYDTTVDEQSLILSGGQRQRLGIARAILKNSPIILFDEPTSALDPENEYLIIESIKNLMDNHTVIIVTHQLSIIKDIPKIVVMNSGTIASSGTHKSLINNCEIYKQLFMKGMNSVEK